MATVEEVGKDAQSGSDKEEEMPELENQGKCDDHEKRGLQIVQPTKFA